MLFVASSIEIAIKLRITLGWFEQSETQQWEGFCWVKQVLTQLTTDKLNLDTG